MSTVIREAQRPVYAPGENDLGPLAWVLEDLRKTLEAATKCLRRHLREADTAEATGATVDPQHLSQASHLLHQCTGALLMIEQHATAGLLQAMETGVQRFASRQLPCTEDAIAKIEQAGFAVTDYLQAVLAGKPASAVELFPQYRDVQILAGSERVHPADLWTPAWQWAVPALPADAAPLAYGPALRSRFDQAVLKIVKSGDPVAARELHGLGLGLAAGSTAAPQRAFWSLAAAYFEALALGLVPTDLYAKRIASRMLTQYAALARGEAEPQARLAQDLLFYCARAQVPAGTQADTLAAVRTAHGVAQATPVDYEQRRFGRFHPTQLAQARKRIAAAAETWSALAGGDTHRIKAAQEQFVQVAEALDRLHPDSRALTQALNRTAETMVRAGQAPPAPLAMEVATAVLYLEAAYADLDQSDAHMRARAELLAGRLDHVLQGGGPEPLQAWMEELYHRVSERQTMGSVVEELGKTLAEVEQALEQFFRAPREKAVLGKVIAQLTQMRGVLSVLGLEKAAHAVLRMRETVDGYMVDALDDAHARNASFDRLGSSLGALGFLIGMLGYQRALAQQLFAYDEDESVFRLVVGQQADSRHMPPATEFGVDIPIDLASVLQPLPDGAAPLAEAAQALADLAPLPPVKDTQEVQVADLVDLPEEEEPEAALPEPEPEPEPEPALAESEDTDADLLQVFLDETRDVLHDGQTAVTALTDTPDERMQLILLRRAFHTLKGSARMVEQADFGAAAAALEDLLNTRLAAHQPAGPLLLALTGDALQTFGRWADDIAAGRDGNWRAHGLLASAHALQRQPAEAVTEPMDALRPAAPDTGSGLAPDWEFTLEPEDTAPEPAVDHPAEAPQGSPDFAATSYMEELPQAPEPAKTATSGVVDIFSSEPEFEFEPATAAPTDADATVWADAPPDFHADTQIQPLSEIDAAPDEPAPAPAEVLAPLPGPAPDDLVKQIGPLRIGLPLFNVYLNEADEWSRRLQTDLGEWALQRSGPLEDDTVALAHSLAGSSATVGFDALSQLARTLELALDHVQQQGLPDDTSEQPLLEAAEDIRRLLHQFAAGFLKEPLPHIQPALEALLQSAPRPDAVADEPAAEALADDEALAFFDFDAAPDAPAPAAPEPEPEPEPHDPAELARAQDELLEHERRIEAAMATAVTGSTAFDEDIDAVDVIDPDLFPIFEEEAIELLPRLSGALRQWHATPGDLQARGDALRALHTLKGSARLAGALRLGELAHRLESAAERLDVESTGAAQIEPLLSHFDALQADLDVLSAVSQRGLQEAPADTANADTDSDAAATPGTPLPVPQALAPRPVSSQSVRVRSQLLDRLVGQAGEVLITRARMEARLGQLRSALGDLTGNLDRLRRHLRDLDIQAESQMQSRLAQSRDTAQAFDPLEFDRFTRVQELTRMMAESVADVAAVQRTLQRTIEGSEDDLVAQGRQARELQRDLLRTRMVEFEAIAERLYGVVRQSSKDLGRQVRLDITGGSIELDRGVLERMAPVFEHLLRNAVVHGIEDAQTRIDAGKPTAGTITIAVTHEANDIAVAVRDDGRGLDLPRIQTKAMSLGLLPTGGMLSASEAADLVFLPGFTTTQQVTELAGRGIGMDVVRSEVQGLGGRIETRSDTGQGTQFKIVLPLTTAVTQVVLLRAGSHTIGVPTDLVEAVRRVPARELAECYQSESFTEAGEPLSFYWAGALLQSSGASLETRDKHANVLVLRSAAQRLALHVDEVLGNQEVVVKNLGPQLSRLPGLAGMSVLASGAVVLLYNPVALAAVYGVPARQAQRDQSLRTGDGGHAPVLPTAPTPLVLVVDDSITVRRVTQRLLQREGYRVALAADGLQALEMLQAERPAIVLSDIEMPRMDGFDLARNIRADASTARLPIVMITSRMAEKHREHALGVGVNHYLGKPYSEEELLSLVRRYANAPD